MKIHTIGVIGGGNMGSAIYKALSASRDQTSLFLVDKNRDKLEKSTTTNSQVAIQAREVIEKVDAIIVAIKPYAFESLAKEIQAYTKDKIVISVMAGKTVQLLQEALHCTQVVRAMPNINALIGKSITTWYSSDGLDTDSQLEIDSIFKSFGTSIQVENELLLNTATSAFGSMPGVFAEVVSILATYIEESGFSKCNAEQLANEVIIGTAFYLDNNRIAASTFRDRLATPGGTTQAALGVLHDAGISNILKRALDSATMRASEL